MRVVSLLLICVVLGGGLYDVDAADYLSAVEIATATGGSAALMQLGRLAKDLDSTRAAWIGGPILLDRQFARWIGGTPRPHATNFLDGPYGAPATPLVTSLILTTGNLSWPRADKGKDALQDLFLFSAGLAATKGVTDIYKGLFARARPLVYMYPEIAAQREEYDYRYDRRAFFSGHTSSAFFSMAYLNLRARAIMRHHMTPSDYRDWRWVSPTVCFSWASFVGLSRIHAWKHYFSDVVFGALAGWLLAELFFSLDDVVYQDSVNTSASTARSTLLQISVRF